MTIDKFIEAHPKATEKEIDACIVNYRGTKKPHKDFIEDYSNQSNDMKFVRFNPFMIIIDPTVRASLYFMKKAIDCHGTSRFFAMKSFLILDTDFNLGWKQGYVPHFLFRCTYFGTAATWYSNTFDQLLQAVYWGYSLYTSVTDRDGNSYDDTWDAKKTMSLCTYEFVVGELKARGLLDVRKKLTSCSGKIEEVRTWANYIKHKGGIDYKYLEPDDPFQVYFVPVEEESNGASTKPPDERFAIKNFKSPIEIDIDEKLPVLENVHQALYECITDIIGLINYDSHKLQFGGKTNG